MYIRMDVSPFSILQLDRTLDRRHSCLGMASHDSQGAAGAQSGGNYTYLPVQIYRASPFILKVKSSAPA
jgi:hypothetical protein